MFRVRKIGKLGEWSRYEGMGLDGCHGVRDRYRDRSFV